MILMETIDGGPWAEDLSTAFYALATCDCAGNARNHRRVIPGNAAPEPTREACA